MGAIILPRSVLEKFRRMAEAKGVHVEELIVERLMGDLDPKARVEVYWEMGEAYLRQAEEELAKGDLRQASEKLWGSATLLVKAIAYAKEGRRLASHRELWEYVDKLIKETGDEEIGSLWRTALTMRINFYEGWAPKEEVERALKNIVNLKGRLEKLKG